VQVLVPAQFKTFEKIFFSPLKIPGVLVKQPDVILNIDEPCRIVYRVKILLGFLVIDKRLPVIGLVIVVDACLLI
jgi:hypothetical protein